MSRGGGGIAAEGVRQAGCSLHTAGVGMHSNGVGMQAQNGRHLLPFLFSLPVLYSLPSFSYKTTLPPRSPRSWQSPGRLHYTIDSLRVDLGGKRLFTLPLPTFLHIDNDLTFFAMREGEWACARSRLGGTMLLVPEPEAGRKLVGSW